MEAFSGLTGATHLPSALFQSVSLERLLRTALGRSVLFPLTSVSTQLWNPEILQVAEVPCDQWFYPVWDMEELQREADKLVQNWHVSIEKTWSYFKIEMQKAEIASLDPWSIKKINLLVVSRLFSCYSSTSVNNLQYVICFFVCNNVTEAWKRLDLQYME